MHYSLHVLEIAMLKNESLFFGGRKSVIKFRIHIIQKIKECIWMEAIKRIKAGLIYEKRRTRCKYKVTSKLVGVGGYNLKSSQELN